MGSELEANKAREILQKYKPFFNQNKKIKIFFDKIGNIIEVNQATIDCYGYAREELLGISIFKLCEWQGRENCIKKIMDSDPKESVVTEMLHKRKDGNTFPAESCIQKLELEGYSFFMALIKEQREKEDRFFKIFNLSPNLMFLSTLKELTILDVNNAFAASLGLPKEEILGKTTSEIGIWVKEEDTRNFLSKLDKEKTVINYETVFKARGGKTKIGLISAGLVRIDNRECVIGVINDITYKKTFENEIMQLELNNILLEMAASISHEVRNPMTTVRGYLQLLRKKNEKCNEFSDVFDLMVDELDRANDLITEFLAIAQKKTGAFQPLNLNSIVKKLLPLLQAEALMKSKFIKIELEYVPKIALNESEIRQVIINLVKNAIDVTPINGFVTIRTKLLGEEKKVILSVEDQGSGISPENISKLGTPFFTTKKNGTGLGLAVCYRILERHQGAIEIETGPSGTVFNVSFNYLSGVTNTLDFPSRT